MVRAILESRKTQTRRIMNFASKLIKEGFDVGMDDIDFRELKEYPDKSYRAIFDTPDNPFSQPCRYGKPNDILWVKETWQKIEGNRFIYRADPVIWGGKWKSGRYMPKEASRIKLHVKTIRVQRLQDISEEDAKAEGCLLTSKTDKGYLFADYKTSFIEYWEDIYGKGAWNINPWVWVIKFEKL
jgi:hypothetical protein